MKNRSLLAACALVVAVAFSGCSSSSSTVNKAPLLGAQIAANPNLSTFMGLAQTAGVDKLLNGKSPLTVLAPSNDAFNALAPDMLAGLSKPENKDQLNRILQNHLIAGSVSLDSLARMTGTLAPRSQLGSQHAVASANDGSLTVGGAKVTATGRAGNGFVHTVDKVILPQ